MGVVLFFALGLITITSARGTLDSSVLLGGVVFVDVVHSADLSNPSHAVNFSHYRIRWMNIRGRNITTINAD